ncbi:olfactory receptor 1-like [Megalops cyprinoides]|uniref:olfactory receptor 1-like n=1 Tax=Megalops cyprinoides TaxID=118141 RepID=UPI00186545D0|nr:olfactory receptor 1-like [Megalops cyprinoides]
MENVSVMTVFVLTAYTEMEDLRNLYFTLFLLLYIFILFFNLIIVIVIYIERGLHKPMYFFICNLAVNGMYGSTSLLPSILVHLMSQTYEISLTCCLLQIFCLHTYASIEIAILAVMGYDRYIAICYPLQYHTIMSPRKAIRLIAFSWVYPCFCFGLYFVMTVQCTFCDRFIDKVYCINFALVRLSCHDTSIHSIVGLVVTVFLLILQVLMILFSYAQILRVCLHASKESQAKAIQTCAPHLLAVLNYAVGCLSEIMQNRSNMSHVSYRDRIFMSLYFLIFPPMLNPVIYGVSIQAIRIQIFKLFKRKKVIF